MTTTRRSPGEGGVYPYTTNQGQRWRIKAMVTLQDGTRRELNKRGFETKKAAQAALREALAASEKGTYSEPSKMLLGAYLQTWLDGLQLRPSTVASYRKNVRLHVTPYLGSVQLSQVTSAMLSSLYRTLETSGRQCGEGKGLSARTVRYIHTILSAAFRDAVDQDLIPRNPCQRSKPPSAVAARSPEMTCWDAQQLGTFLAWSKDNSELHAAWWTLAMTGMRRGELLALRWQDIDLAAGTITVKRSATLVRIKGDGGKIDTGPTKSGKARVVDIDDATVAVLKAHKSARGSLHLSLAQPDSLVFGTVENQSRQPEHFSRAWMRSIERCGQVPAIRLHDLRHTHASLLLLAGTPVKVVSERLGHSSAVITMTVYSHVLPGHQKAAAESFAALVAGAQ